MNLTKRDKKLLFFLLIFSIITLGGHFLIVKPLQAQKILKARYGELQQQKETLDYRLSQKETHKENIKSLEDVLQAYVEQLTRELSKEQVDNLLSTMIVSHQLNPMSLSLGGIQDINGGDRATVLSLPIQMNVNGSLVDARKLLTALQQIPYSKVERFTLANDERSSHTFQLTLYMMAQELVGDSVDETSDTN